MHNAEQIIEAIRPREAAAKVEYSLAGMGAWIGKFYS
jgi:hypothetical protein